MPILSAVPRCQILEQQFLRLSGLREMLLIEQTCDGGYSTQSVGVKYTPAHVCGFAILYGELLKQGRAVKQVVEHVAAK